MQLVFTYRFDNYTSATALGIKRDLYGLFSYSRGWPMIKRDSDRTIGYVKPLISIEKINKEIHKKAKAYNKLYPTQSHRPRNQSVTTWQLTTC